MFLNPYLKSNDEEFYQIVRNFSRDKVFPTVLARDGEASWDKNIWLEMGKAGLTGLPIPSEYGGQDANCLQCCHALEAFNSGSADSGIAMAWGAHMIIGTLPIILYGTKEQKEKYLPSLASGKRIAGLGLTEPGSGSDAAALTTSAKPINSGFIMNGSKMFITNATIGDIFIIMARTLEKKSRGPAGISAFIVEKEFSGFSTSKPFSKLGAHTSQTGELVFDDMQIPEENLLGPLHSGFLRIGKSTLEWERTILIAAFATGVMEFLVDVSIRYAYQRKQFAQPILDFYAIQEKIARGWLYLQSGRRYTYYVARKKDMDMSLPLQSSIVKLYTSECVEELSSLAIQIHGGYGCMKEYHVERCYRDVRIGSIGAGTSEIQRSIIAATFPRYNEWLILLEDTVSENDRIKAEKIYGSSIAQTELEILLLLKQLVGDVCVKVKNSKSQMLEFALADLIMITTILQQSYWDVAISSLHYSSEHKKRDFVILNWFLISKYQKSLRDLSHFSPVISHKLAQAYNDLIITEAFINELIDFLKAGII